MSNWWCQPLCRLERPGTLTSDARGCGEKEVRTSQKKILCALLTLTYTIRHWYFLTNFQERRIYDDKIHLWRYVDPCNRFTCLCPDQPEVKLCHPFGDGWNQPAIDIRPTAAKRQGCRNRGTTIHGLSNTAAPTCCFVTRTTLKSQEQKYD